MSDCYLYRYLLICDMEIQITIWKMFKLALKIIIKFALRSFTKTLTNSENTYVQIPTQ